MTTKRVSPLALAPAIASVLLAVGVMTAFSACGMKDDGTWMRCHDAQIAIAGCAAAMTVACVAALFAGNGKAKAALYAFGAVGAAVVFAIPGGIVEMCMMQTMRCYEVMQPFARIMAVVVFVLCAVCAVAAWRAGAHDAQAGS